MGLKTFNLKCSYNNNNNNYENNNNNNYTYPQPIEIPWNKDICNNIQLIGNVGADVDFRRFGSGKVLASTRIAVKKSANDTTWVNLTFWDDLAHIAYQHVEKGNQIYVSGRLISDTVENDEGKQQTYYKVVVQELNFVEKSTSSFALSDRNPDFSMAAKRVANNAGNSATGASTEELWQAFFANPTEWWDNRNNKRNPKYPDFKHKDTGEALWIEGRYNPHWVKSQLAILDTRMGSLRDQDTKGRAGYVSTDDLVDLVWDE
ncbi:hypothetical protein ACFE04_013525 [Oxalis oulophora]